MLLTHPMTTMDRPDWTLPISLAIGFHVFVFLSVIYLPQIFKPSVKFPEIYSVKLVNIAETQIDEAPAPPPKVTEPKKIETKVEDIKIKPIEVKKTVPVVKPKPVTAPIKKAVSIKPLRRKIKKKIEKKIIKPPPPSNREAEKKLERAKQLERQAEIDARLAAQQVEKIKQQLQGDRRIKQGGQRSNISNLLESRYQAQIFSRLQQYWSLPDHKIWDPNLSALVVITIRSDGKVVNRYFEKKSGDRFFDQFVISTLQKAGDMPPIPPALKRQMYKIGLRFKPESIQ